ncbi:Aste57867_6070 [Aphanomyces stellatus]|uniref:Aste57867_6070 protein n=1 Tax=Aphanomyces stellatus TaxID=120398 RepID=A0A485KDU1_9STRA|nr:hypothetical protein As57867_006056 [Aphanomyces stellatus]VFT83081.1 Aste57867_6070 [Aphanomyces stellatus]
MFSFGLVAGHVWVGRPLVLLRGFVAICLLSTSTLTLTQPYAGLVSFFASPDETWFTTLLCCSEISWLVSVVVDTFSFVTNGYTYAYSFTSIASVTFAAAGWCLALPTIHVVSMDRACTVTAVDFDAVCMSGRVQIGDFGRCWGLIILACGGALVSYVVERLRSRHAPPPTLDTLSHFLYSTAKFAFERRQHQLWEHGGVYYLDRASAVLTGVLTLHHGGSIFMMDIKTWRLYAITPDQLAPPDRTKQIPVHLAHALPLAQ